VLILFGIGILLGLAASPPVAEKNGFDPFHYVQRQAFFGGLALTAMFLTSMMSSQVVRRLAVLGFLAAFVALILLPVYTRYLRPDEYGVLAILDVTVAVLNIVLGAGLVQAVSRFHFDTEDQEDQARIWWTGLLLVCLTASVVVGPALLLRNSMSALLLGSDYAEGGVFIALMRSRLDLIAVTRTLLFAMVLLSTTAHPWYALWALALLPIAPSVSLWVASLTLTLGYAALAQPATWDIPVWTYIVAYIPVYVAVVCELLVARQRVSRGHNSVEDEAPAGSAIA